ncbi:MAG: hypothetical protein ACREIA_17710, partial [Opitutaceae bacterium]
GKPPDMPDAKKTGLTGFAGKPPRRVSLRITVDVETREAAERIGEEKKGHALPLTFSLAAAASLHFVVGMARKHRLGMS